MKSLGLFVVLMSLFCSEDFSKTLKIQGQMMNDLGRPVK